MRLPRPHNAPPARRYVVERVVVEGNSQTKRFVILRKLRIAAGDTLAADDPRVEAARLALLGTGWFKDVSFELGKGSKPGRVVLTVTVDERGTTVLQQVSFGYSEATPFWLGLDIAEHNFLGRGLHISGAVLIAAASSDIVGARLQHAWRLRFSWPGLIGGRAGLSLALLYNDANEYFRIRGDHPDGADVQNFTAIRYRRGGGLFSFSTPLGRHNLIFASYRFEALWARVPVSPVREFGDGRLERYELDLRRGSSYLSSFLFSFVRDSRDNSAIPSRGHRLSVTGELATTWFGSDYQFAKLKARFDQYWRLPWHRHVLSLHLFAGIVVGRTPLYNKFFIGDLSDLLPSRFLELNFSTRPTRNLLGNSIVNKRYETVAGRVAVAYAIPLSKGGRVVYSSDFYVSVGLITLLSQRDFRVRDEGLRRAVPLDLTFDLGFRMDTIVGVFTITLGNAFGWVPR